MNAIQPINDLLQKKMDRRDFLKYVGLGLISVAGVGTALKIAGYKMAEPKDFVASRGGSPYGMSMYGGGK